MRQGVAVGDDAVMRAHMVVGGVFVIMIVKGRAPVGGRRALEEREEAASLHAGGDGQAGGLEEGFGEIEVGNQILVGAAGLDGSRPADEQRRARGFLENPAFVEPAVFAEEEALVGGVDDDGVGGQAGVVEVLQEAPDAVIQAFDAAEVVVHEAVVFPFGERAAGELLFQERLVARRVVGVPGFFLIRREVRRVGELAVLVQPHRFCNGHVLVRLGQAAAGVIVEQSVRQGIGAVMVEIQIAQGRFPAAVRRLVPAEQQERFGRVALFQPVQRQVGDEVGDVAGMLHTSGRRGSSVGL